MDHLQLPWTLDLTAEAILASLSSLDPDRQRTANEMHTHNTKAMPPHHGHGNPHTSPSFSVIKFEGDKLI
jgi:hypothetical protein